MSLLMSEDKKEIIITCNCHCGEGFHIIVDDEDDEYYGYLCFLKNNCDTEYDISPWRAFKIKMKKIWCILCNKDYYYSDTLMTKKEFDTLKEYINQF